ncbi:MAG TPA: hypothetical protein VHA11_14045 [Bryobacteraceae bacterium]|nr:hypothetical protein [Bryobacteraceae bacterium]
MGRRSVVVDEGAFGAWRTAGEAEVECSCAVLEQLRAEAVDAFRAVPHGGMETGGVLFGVRQAGTLRIMAQVPLACEHAHGPGFVLSANDENALREVLRGTDPRVAGLRPLGWYRSRTRGDVPLSARDLDLHAKYFPEPWQIVLVLRPEGSAIARGAFFARAAEGGLAAGEEVVIAPAARRKYEDAPDLRVLPAPPRNPGIVRDGTPQRDVPGFVARAEESSRHPAPWRWMLATLLSLCLAAVFAGVSYGTRTAPAGSPDIRLRAMDVHGQLMITWDRRARPALQARRAVLEIADGGRRTTVDLDHESVIRGSVAYVRQSGRVDLRMKVYSSGGAVEERVLFLGGDPIVDLR